VKTTIMKPGNPGKEMEWWSIGVMGGGQADLGTKVGTSITAAKSQEEERVNR
jgi:hypothetical protein